ncbi:YCF48-related protein [Pseudomonas citronellolis]|uniref:YCF48-related protein n=1 Tax=Pseudomonas citronellolis TaxID=53408 RepID=UPI0023E444B4|nr:YCF48-related protein [Pseudomonas citronellolis]MDF3931532.1 YCF48-related protein [Pseudomonas citronellolis]
MREPMRHAIREQSVASLGHRISGSLLPLRKSISLLGALSFLWLAAAPLAASAAEAAAGADDGYAISSAKAGNSLLLSVSHAGKRLVAVGDRGHILFSDDNGKTWAQAKVPTRQMLTAVYFVNDKKGWAVGHDAQILVSDDAGATWTRQFEDLKREAPLLDVWFQDENHGLAVGAYGAMLETRDGGKSWEDVSSRLDNEDQFHLNGIAAVKDSGLLVVGESGSLFRSKDWGETWEKLQGPYEGSLFGAVGTAKSGTVLVYGLRGHLFRSSDFGDHWEQVALPIAGDGNLEFGLAEGSLLPDGSIAVVGNGGSVLLSKDDGQTFSIFNRPDRLALAGVGAAGDGNLVLVGQGGIHLASATGAELTEQQ